MVLDPGRVLLGFGPELLRQAGSGGKTVVLALDQSRISEGFECLMLSLRLGDRALPLMFRVVPTKGPIGFAVQKALLDQAHAMAPPGAQILLTADRFYGTAALIGWCQAAGWGYRIRLKGNLTLTQDGGEITTGDLPALMPQGIENAELYGSGVITAIGVLHEPGHVEPWIIAMDGPPTKAKTRDYGMRWGIEALFSDFKSRGFGVAQTQLKHADRIERLLLALTIALYHAVSTAMKPDPAPPKYTPKKPIAA